ncbi:DUF1800 family protein [Aquipseudomonas alcaligenes]|uniref:DUF1800 domain-containing protein n=1 Tax=Aquipseudomonas alcaligenes TaxID=43263 RepID=UPI0015E879FB|nr:DUF1800 domain-containing protein [Pseudomonas alcaligenes]
MIEQLTDVVDLLNQASMGPTRAAVAEFQALGAEDWFETQRDLPQTLHYPLLAAVSGAPTMFERLDVWMRVALTAEDQLRQRVAFALSQLFVVSDKDTLSSQQLALAHYYDLLARHALGNYRDLLLDVSLHPVMGEYLSMKGNQKENPALNIRPDENYARELLQLFSLGTVRLDDWGRTLEDANGIEIATYSQADIESMARVLTGWHFSNAERFNYPVQQNWLEPMEPFEDYHDVGEKTVSFCPTFPAGQTAEQDLQAAVDCIFNHPNTAVLVSRHLIHRLVTSNPTPAYLNRVVQVFKNNGQGVRGDLFALVKAILMDPEAAAIPADRARRVKEPLLRLTQVWRFFEAATSDHRYHLVDPDWAFYQAPLRSPSVFNFYPVFHYIDAGKTTNYPEFYLIDDHALTEFTNLMTNSSLWWNSTRTPIPGMPFLDLAHYNDAADAEILSDLNTYLFAGRLSAEVLDAVEEHLANTAGAASQPTDQVKEAMTLLLSSPEFAAW